MGIKMGRGQKVFDLEYGTEASMDTDEDNFIGLIMKTRKIYMPLDYCE